MSYTLLPRLAIRLFGAACLAGIAVEGWAAGEIYKWVDREGRVAYSDVRPGEDYVRAEEVRVPPRADIPPPTDWSKKDLEFRQRQIARAEEQRIADEKRRQDCLRARAMEAQWQRAEGSLVYRTDKGGARAYIDDPQREALRRENARAIAENCSPSR